MNKITIQKSKQIWRGFISEGHTGYQDVGQDIVCASISILVLNTINSIEKFLPETKFQVETKDALIKFKLECIPDEKTTLLLNTMQFGLEEIEKEYKKKYVKLKFEEV